MGILNSMGESEVLAQPLRLSNDVTRSPTRAAWAPLLLTLAVLSGCAQAPSKPVVHAYMPIGKQTTQVDLAQQGMALLALRIAQGDFKGIPELFEVRVIKLDAGKPSGGPATVFSAEPDYRNRYTDQQKFRDYLVSMQLDPGDYRITILHIGTYTSNAVKVNGYFGVFGDFRVQPREVAYIGSMKAVMRKRQCGELRILGVATTKGAVSNLAAAGVPFLDIVVKGVASSALGYDSGTFDIDVFNNVDRDLSVLRAEYPALRSLKVESGKILTINGLTEDQKRTACAKEKEKSAADVVGSSN